MTSSGGTKNSILKALKCGNCEKLAELLNSKLDGISGDMAVDPANNRILHRAARYGKIDVVKRLLQDYKSDPNATNKFGMTPLHHAAVLGSAEIIETLIDYGANAKIADDNKRLPLHWACASAHVDAVKVLIEKGKSSCDKPDKEGFKPIHRACQESPFAKKEELEAMTKEDIVQQDKNRAKVVKILVKKGAYPNDKEPNSQSTPLHLASMNGYSHVCKALIDLGADVNATNKISKTPLMYAAAEDKIKCLEVLASAVEIDLNKVDILHNDWSALHFAILQDNVEAVKLLVDAGADPDQKDGIGRKPLVIAEDHFKENVAKYLKSI